MSTSNMTEFVPREELIRLQRNLDNFFLIVNGMLVFLMQCGFAFLEAGSVRSKNLTNILIKNLFDSFIAGVAYWLFGYAFAFGEGNLFIGYSHFALSDVEPWKFAEFFFQYVFAATAATILSGALAERCEFVAYFIYSFLITGFIYPVVTHWVWSDGWLAAGSEYTIANETVTVAFKDFAGSGVVHVVGGTASFVGAILLGARIGRFHSDSKTVVFLRGHSVPFAALGGFILLFGFLAFNGGSALSISKEHDGALVSLAVVNTIISGSVSAASTLFLQKTGLVGNSRWSLLTTLNGALAGMVAVCAGCERYYPWGAAVVGFIASIAFKFTSWFVLKLKVDDPLDAVAVHFGGGTWGVIAVAFLDKQNGILLHWNQLSGLQLAWQLCGWAAIAGWSGVLSLLMFGIMRLAGILRVPEEVERKGLDIPKHGEPAYPLESYGHGHIERIMRILESGQLQYYLQGAGIENGGYEKGPDENDPEAVVHTGYETPEVDVLKNNRNGHIQVEEENTSL